MTLRDELLAWIAEEDELTAALTRTGELYEGYAPALATLHERNARRLEAILDRTGWPGTSLAGEEGAAAAWRIAQHAIGLPEFQRRVLEHIRSAVAAREAPPWQAAFLEDRIRMFEGRPQRYGTQFDWDESGEMSPHPLEEPDRVDELRRSVGLGPMAERIEQARSVARSEPKPKDFRGRRAEFEAWARSVGWR